MASKSEFGRTFPPLGINREFAARHIGVGPTLFDEMVADGRMPPPRLINTGARRSDVVNFGRQHVRDGEHMSPALREQHSGRWLQYTQHKNRNKKPITLTLPILPELEEILAASPVGDLTWLVTEFGKGFTPAGFGNWFRDQCNRANLRHCSAHGLRKAGATIAAENGASVHALKSMFGWQTLKQAEHYTKAADQKRLAASGMRLLGRGKK